jgi:cell wall-associated NlpC family hydrolase
LDLLTGHTAVPARLRRFGVLVIAACTLATMIATPAQAKPSVSEIEAQIAAMSNKLEPLIEDYNRVHAELRSNQKQAAVLEAKLQPLQLQITLAQSRSGRIAAQLYEDGPASVMRTVLAAGSSDDVLSMMSLAEEMAHQRQEQISGVIKLRDRYASAKAGVDKLHASLAAQDSYLAQQKNKIEAQVAHLQKLRQQAYGTTGAIGSLRPVACPFLYTTGKGGIAARKACSAIGKPYVWAADGPSSFDCSGLTLWAWAAAGVTLRHYTRWQWDDTRSVSRANLRPGDLVFYFPPSLHHVAIYVGGGWVVHAPHTGDYVRMTRIDSFPIAGYRRPG